MSSEIRLRSEWLSLLESEFEQPYMSQLSAFLRAEKAAGKTIYPPGGQFFAALEATPPEAVKVVAAKAAVMTAVLAADTIAVTKVAAMVVVSKAPHPAIWTTKSHSKA